MDDYVGVTMCFFWGDVTKLSRMVSRKFLEKYFSLVGTPPARNGDLVGVWPILGLWHLEEFRARAENTKPQFPGARGLCGKKCDLAFQVPEAQNGPLGTRSRSTIKNRYIN